VKATSPGVYDNISGYVTSLYSGANTTSTGIARATLTAVLPPQIEKEFEPPLIETSAYGGVSTLTLTITNPNSAYNQGGVSFTDQFPANLIVADPPGISNGCGGTLEDHLGAGLAAGDGGIKLSGVTLNAGQSCTVAIKVTSATAGYYENQSGAVTHLINGVARGGDTASAALAVKARNPAISLLKQVGPSLTGPWGSKLIVEPSAAIYYRFTVENIGDVTLSDVTISEDPDEAWIDLSPCVWKDGDGDLVDGDGNNIFTLPVADADGGHTASCTIAATAAVSGTHPNTAKATGTFTPTTVTDTSTATYVVSALELIKSVTETTYRAEGDTLHYSYAVKNSGAATLIGPLTISDDKISSTAITCPAGDLAAGATITCTATYTVTDADERNRLVTNNARGKISGFFTPVDSVTVTMLAADLSAVKSNDVGGVAGEG
ncbi:MAG TPA: hypothetical protein VLA15_08905, partial [Desulfurivibrionaceae bacterium]|nr:hypothetical protein [Desulfurivibrionaceae bacterium]